MTDIVQMTGMGLTPRMKEALDAIVAFVARHGAMPSRRLLAAEIGCNPNNAQRLITSLTERGELNSLTPGGALSGFGSAGVAVFVPAHIASHLAAFCVAHSEKIGAVVADAIALHIDQCDAAGQLITNDRLGVKFLEGAMTDAYAAGYRPPGGPDPALDRALDAVDKAMQEPK